MKLIADIIKGAIVGVANIIPGVSGGTMAVSMNIYDSIIYAVTHIFKEFRKSLATLAPYGIGMVLGIIGLSFLIEFLYETYPVQTCFTFIGLIISGFPAIYKKINHRPIKAGNGGLFALFFTFIILLQLLDGTGGSVTLSISLGQMILLFFIGIIASATMVVPGVSGSMILMLMGYYHPIIETINATVKGLGSMDIGALTHGAAILGPFGFGILAGIFLIAKIIDALLHRHQTSTYFAIAGLVAASPVALIMGLDFSGATAYTFASALILLAGGAILPNKLLPILEKQI